MKSSKKIILTVIHLFITFSTIFLTVKGVLKGAAPGQLGEHMINWGYFKAFTIDSNDLSAIASLIFAVYLIISLIKKEDHLPYAVVLFQFISAVGVALTFLTTATFLAPNQVAIGNSYWLFFSGDTFFLHFLNPILAICAFIFGSKDYEFKTKENLLGLVPIFIYAIVYMICVVFLKTWTDFYGFTFGGHYALIAPVIVIVFGISYLLGFLMIFAQKHIK